MESKINRYSKQLILINSLFILVWLVISVFPFIWTFWGSFKVKADFFSRADWMFAVTGVNTLIETGDTSTVKAYVESWTEGEFWKANNEYNHNNCICCNHFFISWNSRCLCSF